MSHRILLTLLFAGLLSAQPAPHLPSKLDVKGPMAVPESTQYTYTSNCQTATWAVTAPGQPATGHGKDLTVDWGAGPAQAKITVTCGRLHPVTLDVEVVQVTLERSRITLGGKAADAGVVGNDIRKVTTEGPPPAVTAAATVKVTGPKGTRWHGKIETGFVQRLVAADSTTWWAAYANKARPPKTSKLFADTVTSPPPKADYDENHSRTRLWYADDSARVIFRPSANDTKTITINHSPSPGWWQHDHKDRSLIIEEAQAIWNFETYVCVRSADAPQVFFRRAIAEWRIEVHFTNGQPATVTGVVRPPTLNSLTASVSADPAQCPTGGQSTNDWLNNTVTFH
jgi:hypothetical protein